MTLALAFALLAGGIFLVVKGADYLVLGSSSLASRHHIPHIVIGLTVVSFGTSAPELAVSLFAAVKGQNEILLGNLVGSNISNLLLVLGVSGLIFPLCVKSKTVTREIPFMVATALVFFGLASGFLLPFSSPLPMFSRLRGFIMLALYGVFSWYVYRLAKNNKTRHDPIHQIKPSLELAAIAGGLVGLFVGGKMVVSSAVSIAVMFGVSAKLIALTIVAIGTSIPELATSAVAAWRKKSDIAVGNIVGSNIMNITLVLGLSTTISPVACAPEMNIDMLIMCIASALFMLTMFTGKRNSFDRLEAGLFLAAYAGYIVFLCMRG